MQIIIIWGIRYCNIKFVFFSCKATVMKKLYQKYGNYGCVKVGYFMRTKWATVNDWSNCENLYKFKILYIEWRTFIMIMDFVLHSVGVMAFLQSFLIAWKKNVEVLVILIISRIVVISLTPVNLLGKCTINRIEV